MSLVIIVVLILLGICLAAGLYQKSTNGICKSKKRLEGKTVIVTGGTLGMGLETAIDLADRGARVIVACPFKQEGIDALNTIKERTSNENVVYKFLDLASFDSVRKFAADILKSEDRLDILVNNAGIGGFPNGKLTTNDGLDYVMQVNYFGHVLLSLLLLPLLKKTGTPQESSRIVNMSSGMHRVAVFGVGDLNKVSNFFTSYIKSKLCLILFSYEMAEKLRGSYVVINSVEPGMVGTTIFKGPGVNVGSVYFGDVLSLIANVFCKTPWEGAQTAIHTAVDEKAGKVSGVLFKDCKPCEPFFWRSRIEMQKVVWEHSIKLIEIEDYELKGLLM